MGADDETQVSQLVAIGFNEPLQAERVRLELLEMQHELLIDIEDIAVATKNDAGELTLSHSTELKVAGATGGSILGAILGSMFAVPIAGAALGASLGALTATNLGLNTVTMKRLCEDLKPGGSVLFVLVMGSDREAVLERLRGIGGQVIESTLSESAEKAIQAALDGGGSQSE